MPVYETGQYLRLDLYMKKLLMLFVCCIAISCKKKVDVRCTDPYIYLSKGNSLAPSDWDTIITHEYLKGFQPPVVSDTFITKPGDVLLVSQSSVTPKDFEIELTSIQKKYRLTNLVINERIEQQTKNAQTGCYNFISYELDGHAAYVNGGRLVYIPLER